MTSTNSSGARWGGLRKPIRWQRCGNTHDTLPAATGFSRMISPVALYPSKETGKALSPPIIPLTPHCSSSKRCSRRPHRLNPATGDLRRHSTEPLPMRMSAIVCSSQPRRSSGRSAPSPPPIAPAAMRPCDRPRKHSTPIRRSSHRLGPGGMPSKIWPAGSFTTSGCN